MLGALGGILGPIISGGMNILGSALAGTPNYKKIANQTFKGDFNARMSMGERYGISKLVMAGAPPVASPAGVVGGSGVGEALGAMGQDISRAVQNFGNAYERQLAAESLKKVRAENELVQAQTRSINVRTAQQVAPPAPGLLPQLSAPPVATTGFNQGSMFAPFKFDPSMSDNSVLQNRYGDESWLTLLHAQAAPLWDMGYNVYPSIRDLVASGGNMVSAAIPEITVSPNYTIPDHMKPYYEPPRSPY